MAVANIHCLSLVVLLVVGALTLGDHHHVSAQCEAKIGDLVSQCGQFVQIAGPKQPPSTGCCNVIKSVDIPCICKFVTPEVEKIVSMEKVVYVAQTCGVTVQRGMKCGSYTVPNA